METENGNKSPIDLEYWVDIIGYKGEYQLSNKGRVRSPRRLNILKNGVKRFLPYREQTIFVNTSGYLSVGLSKNNKQRQWLLHRLMAIHFIPNPKNKPHINHINGIKTDFRIENLEWCTQSENNLHAYKTGLSSAKGEKNNQSRLNENAVLDIRQNCPMTKNAGRDIDRYAKKYGVHKSTVRDVVWKRTWTHI